MTDSIEIPQLKSTVMGSICPPGSKSLTNRALITAALADGQSHLSGVLESQDTQVMRESLKRLEFPLSDSADNSTIEITGFGGDIRSAAAELWLENSGTSIRFLTALCSLGHGQFQLDGNQRMRERPIEPLVETLNQLGADVRCIEKNGCPPIEIHAKGLNGGKATVAGNISSQYLSALLMIAPCAKETLTLELSSELVSRPYIDMTLAVMKSFGVIVDQSNNNQFIIKPQKYQAVNYVIEPDASAASYFFALAAITGGEITVENLTRNSLQGGCLLLWMLLSKWVAMSPKMKIPLTVKGAPLKGIDIDMNAISDTAQTLAVVAAYAEGPTRIHNIAHVRHKETDRISAVVTELKRAGLKAEEFEDGMTIHPGKVKPASIKTYDDHRIGNEFCNFWD